VLIYANYLYSFNYEQIKLGSKKLASKLARLFTCLQDFLLVKNGL